jgi:hypothetical protein
VSGDGKTSSAARQRIDAAFDRVQLTKPAFEARKSARASFILMADQVTDEYVIVTAGDDLGTRIQTLGRFKVMRGGPVLWEDPQTDAWVPAEAALPDVKP